MDPRERARYSRQIRLPGFGEGAQERLRRSSALIIGLGGLGSPASLYLAAAGIGRLGLAEFDAVEEHNLHRQVVHTRQSVGQSKLASARARLSALNPDVELVDHPEGVTVDNAHDLLRQYDVVLDGADNFPTRYLLSDVAVEVGVPIVSGSVFQYEGQVTVWDPAGGGPCYRCLFPEMPGAGEVPNCEEGGVIGALCGVVGAAQAMEAIKLLTGVGEPLRGRLLVWDSLAAAPRVLKTRRDPDCPACGSRPRLGPFSAARYGTACGAPPPPAPATPGADAAASLPADPAEWPEEIDAVTTQALLSRAEPPALLDVREDSEVAIGSISGRLHIPLRQLPHTLDALPQDRPVVVYCHHGFRSLQATRFLRAHGIPATSMRGGIDAWSRQIDPSIPRY